MTCREDMAILMAERSHRGVAVVSDRLLYANPAFCDKTGWHDGSVENTPLNDILLTPAPSQDGMPEHEPRRVKLRHRESGHPPLHAEFFPGFGLLFLPEEHTLSLTRKQLHDIRNPLNTILGYGRVCQEDERLVAEHRKAAESIVRSAEQIQAHLCDGMQKGVSEGAVRALIPQDVPLHTPKVLIVDDDADNRDVLGLFLKKYPFTLLYAENGAAALDIASREEPELILMDLHMPDMDGGEAARRIRERQINSKIVALSADIMALEKGSDIFDLTLTKPFDRAALRRVIADLTGISMPAKEIGLPVTSPAPERLPESELEAIAAAALAGRISTLETLLKECSDATVRDFLGERLRNFDLEGIVRWCREVSVS